jgi:hypothetical protein
MNATARRPHRAVRRNRHGMEQTFHDCKPEISTALLRYIKKYGIGVHTNYDELAADVNLDFVTACYKWDRNKCEFPKYLYKYLLFQMMERQRVACMRNNRIRRDYDFDVDCPIEPNESTFSLPDFVSDLSDDACAVIEMIFSSPIDVRSCLVERGAGTDLHLANPGTARAAIRQCLRDLGWSVQRITSTFLEIYNAL